MDLVGIGGHRVSGKMRPKRKYLVPYPLRFFLCVGISKIYPIGRNEVLFLEQNWPDMRAYFSVFRRYFFALPIG
jgi:hypothetical protein